MMSLFVDLDLLLASHSLRMGFLIGVAKPVNGARDQQIDPDAFTIAIDRAIAARSEWTRAEPVQP